MPASHSPFLTALASAVLAFVVCPVAVLHGHGSFHERIETLGAALREKPDDPVLLYRLAVEYLEHGEWETALTHLARIDAVAPGVVGTGLPRGRALAAGGKFAEARAALDGYLAAQPGHAAALAVRARVVSELGDAQQAAADCAASVAATPRPEPDAYFELANFLVAASRGTDAVRALDDGIGRLGPVPALVDRAIELELTLDHAEAALARSAARAKTPSTRAAHAALLARTGRPTEARAAWEALRAELAALPPLDRSSHAMLQLAERANRALAASTP
jgi:predicted Zn-dependent protease